MNDSNTNSMSASETFECLQCGADVVGGGLTFWCERCERNGPDDPEEEMTMADVPVADAMEEAQAALDEAALAAMDAEYTPPASADTPVQVPLFDPPPFDFEEAYDALHRLDRRAQNRKSAWESLKGAASDAKKDYDSAINDLHVKFDEIDSARRVAAAVHVAPTSTQEEVKPQMSSMEQTIDDPTVPEEAPPPEEPTDDEPSSDAPND